MTQSKLLGGVFYHVPKGVIHHSKEQTGQV